MGRVSHVVSIADDMSHNPYFHGFISGNEKQPVRSILIRSAFSSCHTLISVSKIRLCLSAVNGATQIHQSSEKELSSLCKKPPRLPASETGGGCQNYRAFGTVIRRFFNTLYLQRTACNSVQREHNKKLNNGLPILHKVPPKRDYGRYFCIMAEKGGTSHGGLTEKLSPFFHAKKQEVNAYGR